MPEPRRLLLVLVLLALLVALFLVWRGSWSDAEFPAGRRSTEASGEKARAATLLGAGSARVDGSGADAEGEGPFAACPVHGRVVDAETGEPVASARYFLWPKGEAPPEDPFAFVDAVEGETECFAGALYAVDPSGRLGFERAFARVARGLGLELHVLADGYVSQALPLEIPGTVEVRLERGLRVSGWVVDATHRVVSQAEVVAWSADPRSRHVVSRTRSGADGAFVLGGLTAEAVSVEASFDTVDALRRSVPRRLVPGADDGVEIALVDLPHVVLDVRTADGGPLRWAVFGADHGWRRDLWQTVWMEAPSARLLAPLPLPPPPLPEEVWLSTYGYRDAVIPLDGRTLDERREVVLEPDGSLGTARLKLVWPADAGEEPVYVRFAWHINPGPLFGEALVGRLVEPGTEEIRVADLWPVGYQVHAVGRTVAHSVAVLDVPSGGEGEATLTLERGGTLEAVFVDAPPIGVAFTLNFAIGLQEHAAGEPLLSREEALPGGLRWGYTFLAVPDGEGRAVGRVFGLAAGSHAVASLRANDGYAGWIHFRIEPGKTTRVVFPRTR